MFARCERTELVRKGASSGCRIYPGTPAPPIFGQYITCVFGVKTMHANPALFCNFSSFASHISSCNPPHHCAMSFNIEDNDYAEIFHSGLGGSPLFCYIPPAY